MDDDYWHPGADLKRHATELVKEYEAKRKVAAAKKKAKKRPRTRRSQNLVVYDDSAEDPSLTFEEGDS